MTRRARSVPDRERVDLSVEAKATLLVEASMPGARDEVIASKWGTNRKLIQRLRAQVGTDPDLRAAVERAWARSDPYDDIRRAIQALTAKAVELALAVRSPKDLRLVRDMIATLGEILVTRDTLGPKPAGEPIAPHRQDPVAPADRPGS